jgi:anti-sigma B factor antagonist
MSQDTLSIDVTSTPDGHVQLFALGGSLDLATSPSLRATLMEAADREKHEIVVDLTHLEFLDSTGLGALIGAHKRAAEHGGSVRLVAQEGQILRLLRITGLLDVFKVYPTLEAALALADDARLVGL